MKTSLLTVCACIGAVLLSSDLAAQRAGTIDVSLTGTARRIPERDSLATRVAALGGLQVEYTFGKNWTLAMQASSTAKGELTPGSEIGASPRRPGLGLSVFELGVVRVVPVHRIGALPLAVRLGAFGSYENYRGARGTGVARDAVALRTSFGFALALGAAPPRWRPSQFRMDFSAPLLHARLRGRPVPADTRTRAAIVAQFSFRMRTADRRPAAAQ